MTPAPKYVVEFETAALADLRKLDPQVVTRIREAIDRYTTFGMGDVKQLQGIHPPCFRLRAARDWRVLFRLSGATMQIVRVDHRSGVYR